MGKVWSTLNVFEVSDNQWLTTMIKTSISYAYCIKIVLMFNKKTYNRTFNCTRVNMQDMQLLLTICVFWSFSAWSIERPCSKGILVDVNVCVLVDRLNSISNFNGIHAWINGIRKWFRPWVTTSCIPPINLLKKKAHWAQINMSSRVGWWLLARINLFTLVANQHVI